MIGATDASISERGLNLTYSRTYNSQTGWSTRWGWGGGWTDTFNARMYYDATRNELSVYDSTGARYDYCANGSGGWSDCTLGNPVIHSTLSYDGGCGYLWTLPSGITFNFTSPVAMCGYANGALGRIYRVYGHNHNNYVQFQYSWLNGDASSDANLTQIQAIHQDGQSLTMTYASDAFGHAVPITLTIPGGSVIRYAYDGNWNLTDVCEVGNGSASIASGPCSSTQVHVAYDGGEEIYNPRWEGTGGADGASVFFDHDDPSTRVGYLGYVNPQPSDGFSSTPIQPDQPSGLQVYRETDIEIGGPTTITDGDGHSASLTLDSLGRVTQSAVLVGSSWQVSSVAWGTNNRVASTVDPRGNETDYTYDTYGNMASAIAPYRATNAGNIRPTTRFSYDQFHNLLATCDAVYIAQTGASSCVATSGVPHYTYDFTDTQEPFGRLVDAYTAQNYHYHLTYGPSGEGGDYGLLTDVLGDSISQDDGTARQPHRTTTYDSYGNVVSTSNGLGSQTYSYDGLNREWGNSDSDGAVTCTWYNADGSVRAIQDPPQNAFAGGTCTPLGVPSQYATSMSYDADGNVVSETQSPGGAYVAGSAPTPPSVSATTQHLFDGDDREFETIEPYDATHDVYANPWITRYLYDISNGGSGGTVAFNGTPITAHGGYFKTQQLLPPGSSDLTWTAGSAKIANTQFRDISGVASDALGRPTATYQFVIGHGVTTTTTSYDATGATGLPYQHCNALAQCATASFDPGTDLIGVQHSDGSTPNETLTYDADGRVVGDTFTSLGTQMYVYNSDGTLSATQEPSTGSSPAQIVYHYYADGSRKAVDVYSSALSQTSLLDYSYRIDGLKQKLTLNNPSNVKVGATSISYAYTPMGRFTQRSEAGPGANGTPSTASYSAGLLTQRSFPGGSMTGFEFDPTGNALGYQVQVPAGGSTRSITHSYTMRGEVAGNYAQGVSVAGTGEWDSLSGVPIAGESFDAAGRTTASGSESRTFDSQDHVVGETYNDSAMTAYTWGSNGHPVRIGSAFGNPPIAGSVQYDSIHWDGDQPLFETNQAGQLVSLNVGADMQVTPTDTTWSGLTTYDRAVDGAVASCHNSSGANGTGNADPYHHTNIHIGTVNSQPCTGSGMQAATTAEWWGAPSLFTPTTGVGTGNVVAMPYTDGIADGFNIIRGVRAFDPELGMWESPDAYAGAIGDPMSSLPYAYARNNGVSYRDPSGLYAAWDCSDGSRPIEDGTDSDGEPKYKCANGKPATPEVTRQQATHCAWYAACSWWTVVIVRSSMFYLIGPYAFIVGNPNAYVKVEGAWAYALGGSAAFSINGCGASFASAGLTAGGGGAAVIGMGVVVPRSGQRSTDVMNGHSVSMSAMGGDGLVGGIEAGGNSSGMQGGIVVGGGGGFVLAGNVSNATPVTKGFC